MEDGETALVTGGLVPPINKNMTFSQLNNKHTIITTIALELILSIMTTITHFIVVIIVCIITIITQTDSQTPLKVTQNQVKTTPITMTDRSTPH